MATWPPENATIQLKDHGGVWGSVSPTSTSIPWEQDFTAFPRDGNDLSILSPSADSRIVFVDATLGNDGTGVIYNNTQAPDPYTYTPANPYLTIAAALSELRAGFPDWLCLKKGEAWTATTHTQMLSGRSATERFVVAAYGVGERPMVDRTVVNGFGTFRFFTNEYWAIQGIETYCSARDPSSGNFVGYGNTDDPEGIEHFSGADGEAPINSGLIENCKVSYYSVAISLAGQAGGSDFVVRKNILQYSWSESAHSQGFWADNRGILCEQNVIDHNGWLIQSILGDNAKDQGQATVFNHNIYWTGAHRTIIRDNTFSRASSMGIKLTANPPGPTDTVESEQVYISGNLVYAGELAIAIGGNTDFNTGPRWRDYYVENNVMKAIGVERPTNRPLAWYMEIKDWDTGRFNGNYMLHEDTVGVTQLETIKIVGHCLHVDAYSTIAQGFPGNVNDYYKIFPEYFVDVAHPPVVQMTNAPTIAEFLTSEGAADWDAYVDSIGIPEAAPIDYFISGVS